MNVFRTRVLGKINPMDIIELSFPGQKSRDILLPTFILFFFEPPLGALQEHTDIGNDSDNSANFVFSPSCSVAAFGKFPSPFYSYPNRQSIGGYKCFFIQKLSFCGRSNIKSIPWSEANDVLFINPFDLSEKVLANLHF